MRLRPLPLHLRTTPHLHPHLRLSSTLPSPLIQITDIPAPHTGTIRILSLNNPATRNAISLRLLAELSDQITTISNTPLDPSSATAPRVLILASALPNAFCSGADLKERKTFTAEQTNTFLHTLRKTLTALASLPIPTLTAINSLALGGGLELALSTHLRICAATSILALPETRLGIIPGAGGTYRLKRLIGEARALDMVLTGRRIAGTMAVKMGLCQRVVKVPEVDKDGSVTGNGGEAVREAVLREAVLIAMEICEGGPVAVGAALRAVLAGREEVEGEEYEGLIGTGDRAEGLRAFEEKRKPVYTGW